LIIGSAILDITAPPIIAAIPVKLIPDNFLRLRLGAARLPTLARRLFLGAAFFGAAMVDYKL
jgi:hypothetical protein